MKFGVVLSSITSPYKRHVVVLTFPKEVIIYYLEALRIVVKEQSKSLTKGVVSVPKPNYKREMAWITFKVRVPNKLVE